MSVDEKLVAMTLEASADVVRIILLQVVEEDHMKTTERLDVHEDLLSGKKKKRGFDGEKITDLIKV